MSPIVVSNVSLKQVPFYPRLGMSAFMYLPVYPNLYLRDEKYDIRIPLVKIVFIREARPISV